MGGVPAMPPRALPVPFLLLLLGGGGLVHCEPPPPRFLCTPVPAEDACAGGPRADPGPYQDPYGAGGAGGDPLGTVLRLREALERQREAALELAAKLGRCEAERGGRGNGGGGEAGKAGGDGVPRPQEEEEEGGTRRALEGLRQRLRQLQSRNASGLREALQKKIRLLELQLHPHGNGTGPHGNGRGHHSEPPPKQHPHGNHHSSHQHSDHHGHHGEHGKAGDHGTLLSNHHEGLHGNHLGHHGDHHSILHSNHHGHHGDHTKAGDHGNHHSILHSNHHGHHGDHSKAGDHGNHHSILHSNHHEGLHGNHRGHHGDHSKAVDHGIHHSILHSNHHGRHGDHSKAGDHGNHHSILHNNHHDGLHGNPHGHHGDHTKSNDYSILHSIHHGPHGDHSKAVDHGNHHSILHSNHHDGLHGSQHGHHGDHSKAGDTAKAHSSLHSSPPGRHGDRADPHVNHSKASEHHHHLHSNHYGQHGNQHHSKHSNNPFEDAHGNRPVYPHGNPYGNRGNHHEEHPWHRHHGDHKDHEEEEDHDDPKDHGDPQDKDKAGPAPFLLSFPLRTNYLFAVARGPVLRRPLAAVSACLWLRPAGGAAALGAPFSYAAPGEPNELVLLGGAGRPLELILNDQAVALSLSPTPGRWHHVCITWSSAGGTWRSYQDGAPRGGGTGLAPGHALRAGGVLVVGQEQDALGGHFDATQSFQGALSGLQLWGRALTAAEVAAVAACRERPRADLLAWTRPALELHGGVTALPFEPCA